jgi:hypothetical protein
MKKFEIKEVKFDEIRDEESEEQKQFAVPTAMKQGGHNRYTVRGIDSDGPFEDTKRFKDFFALR